MLGCGSGRRRWGRGVSRRGRRVPVLMTQNSVRAPAPHSAIRRHLTWLLRSTRSGQSDRRTKLSYDVTLWLLVSNGGGLTGPRARYIPCVVITPVCLLRTYLSRHCRRRCPTSVCVVIIILSFTLTLTVTGCITIYPFD